MEIFDNVKKYIIRFKNDELEVTKEEFIKSFENQPKSYLFFEDDFVKLLETNRVESAFFMAALHTSGAIVTVEK